MTSKDIFKTAFFGLRANKMRSILTIIGIIIGISSIMLVMSIGRGAEDLILNQIRGLGSRTIIIEPGREPSGPSVLAEIFTDSLKIREVEALKNPVNVPGLKGLTPVVMRVTPVAFENETLRTNIIGISELMFEILDIYPSEGYLFGDEDVKQMASVAVIGSEVKRKLFGHSDALGRKIKIKGKNFKIIGIVPPKGQVALFNVDDMVAVPYTTAQKYIAGINYFSPLIVQAENEEIVPRVANDIKITLRGLHNITDPEKDDFHITTQADAVERVNTVTGIITALLVSVAAISLVVGGIGIMNIMLVSVTERTREIGLRKAIGATDNNILAQFLTEAVMLTFAGGIAGIIVGTGLSFIGSLVLSKFVARDWPFSFPLEAAILALGVSVFIGIIFGLQPARQASRKSPIEALRYE